MIFNELLIGIKVLEEVYNVKYEELHDNQEEIGQQITADKNGYGINNLD